MNPIVQAVLGNVINLIEVAIKGEGPAVLSWIEAELEKLKLKYGPPPQG